VLVDGVPVNQPGGALDLAHLGLENVERIEVLRGPASVLYGSDAVTGVVNVLTRKARGAARVTAGARAGSHGTREAGFEVLEAAELAQLSFAASRLTSEGTLAFNNGYHRSAAGGRLVLSPGGGFELSLTARRTAATYRFPTDASGAATDSNQLSGNLATTLGMDAAQRLSHRLEIALRLASQENVARFRNPPDAPGDPESGVARSSQSRRSAELRASYRTGPAVATAGTAVEEQQVDASSAYQSAFGPFGAVSGAARTNRALYAEVLADYGRVSFQAGSRLDDNQRFGSFITARAGMVIRALPTLRLRGSWGTSFKEPTFDENFGSGFGDVGNPGLRPERATGWEAGLEHQAAGGRARVAATWFEQRFRDMIQFTFSVPPGELNYHNVAGARAGGLEVEGRAAPGLGFEVEGRYTWLSTEAVDSGFGGVLFAKGERLVRRPGHTLWLASTWRGPRGALAGVGLSRTGRRSDIDFSVFPAARVDLEGYVRWDAWADLPLVSGSGRELRATLRVENLADRAYQEVLGFPARGRIVLVGIRAAAER
jgi:vitamin B12 transporter